MIDLNPYFRKKLGETLVFNSQQYEKYLMEVISITDTPNAVYLEVESRSQSINKIDMSSKYHGVVEVDLNLVESVRSVKQAVVSCLKNERSTAKARKLNN
tara:strand:+ start:191 stop:490 length:300 start_codon:yes stop_codon:yes gene_type:complete